MGPIISSQVHYGLSRLSDLLVLTPEMAVALHVA